VNCPACNHTLSEHTISGVTVDICRGGCGGVWFDNHELDKVDESFEPADEGLLDVPCDPAPIMDNTARRNCPRCDDMVMMRHCFTVRREIEVDECPACGGVFLDHGELAAIRGQFASEDDRRQAARDHFGDLFDPELDEVSEATEESISRNRRFARAMRVLLPSWWMKGKQPWGAF